MTKFTVMTEDTRGPDTIMSYECYSTHDHYCGKSPGAADVVDPPNRQVWGFYQRIINVRGLLLCPYKAFVHHRQHTMV